MNNLLGDLSVFLSGSGFSWFICGGDAIDLFVGKLTRKHKDLDVGLFWDQRKEIIEFMLARNWRVFEPDKGRLYEVSNSSSDKKIEDNLWCIKPDNPSYILKEIKNNQYRVVDKSVHQEDLDFIEYLFNSKKNGYFLYKRNHDIKREMKKAIIEKEGIEFLAPEIVLLYKSIFVKNNYNFTKEVINNYKHDFNVAYPVMDAEQKSWLKSALHKEYPNGHLWLDMFKI